MAKVRFIDHPINVEIDRLARSSDHQALGIWAAECAERVLPLFEKEFPEDERPRLATVKLREWVTTGEFHMAEVREVSLNAHAAARSALVGSAARFAARACGQAMATAHVPTHSIAAARYAAKAVWASDPENPETVSVERHWQYRCLMDVQKVASKEHRLV